jgi:hypothetical protein
MQAKLEGGIAMVMAFGDFDGDAYGPSRNGTGTIPHEMKETGILTILSARLTAPTVVAVISAPSYLEIYSVPLDVVHDFNEAPS